MNRITRTTLCFAVLALSASLANGQEGAGGATKRLPGDIKFTANPANPGGLQTAVLYGNPRESGLFAMQVKMPAGFKAPPHYHPDFPRTIVVLSGTLYFGAGDRWDETKLDARPAGTFFIEAPKQPHFVWAKDGEVILHITSMGPTASVRIEQPK